MRKVWLTALAALLTLGTPLGSASAAGDEVRFVQADGISVAYTEKGTGEPLVLLHGGGLTSAMWGKQVDALAAHYRVILPDTRGHGRTDNPDHAFGYTLLADDVAAFCRALGLEKPIIMGYSDGGITTLTVGIRHPELARALVVGGAVPPVEAEDMRHYFEGMAAYYAPVTKRADLTDADLDAMYKADPESWSFFAKQHAKPGRDDFWRTLMKDVWNTWNQPESYAYTAEQLAAVHVPVLGVLGERDECFRPVAAARLADALPAGELAVVPGAGHNAFRAKAELFNSLVLDFLRRQGA